MTASLGANLPRARKIVLELVESRLFTRTIIGLILINAVILGLETSPAMMARHGPALIAADQVILGIFVVELSLRMFAHRGAFFRDPWSLFDTAVVAIALFPASEAFSVLRALRVLRVLRLVSAFPQLRRVIQGLLTAIPGLGSIAAILVILLYIFAVIAVKLFGAQYPQWFGDFGAALFTLFQIMTLEGWADIAREIQQTHPYAWTFFVIYILVSTFAVLNLFIAVIVDAMQKSEEGMEHHLQAAIDSLGRKIDDMAAKLELPPGPQTTGSADRRGTDA
ncbi:MAG: ion transporter [Xanthobacteraceae bacterium]